jgi:drug/metabolite transporter (DMT)-like permease
MLVGPHIAAAGLVVMWSSGFIGARLGTDHAPADSLLAWRYAVFAALLVGWTIARGRWIPRESLTRHAVIGWLTHCGYLGGVVTGVGLGVPAGTAALIAALQPLVVAVLAGTFLGERISQRQWWGFWIGIAGVGLVVAGDMGNSSAPVAAYLLPLGGMVALSIGSVLERRWRPAGTVVQALTVHSVIAAIFFVGVAGFTGHVIPPSNGAFWIAVVWTVVLSGFGGYGFYLLVLRQSGATRVSAVLFLTPPMTMIWAFLMFSDPMTLPGIVGLVVCAVAVRMAWGRSVVEER